MLERILSVLDAMKAEDVVVIDLKGRSILADYMLIACGTSQRHVQAMAERLRDQLKAEYKTRAAIEGLNGSDWVLLDAGDMIVHLFLPEARRHYALEKMWSETLFPSELSRLAQL